METLANSNSTLEHLSLSCNRLGSNSVAAICEMLKTNSTLKYLSLAFSNINTETASMLADVLTTNSSLKHLNIHGCRLGNDGIKIIGTALKINTTLAHLDLSRNCVKDSSVVEAINELVEILKSNDPNPKTSITKLGLSDNNLTKEQKKLIAKTLENRTVKHLKL